MYRKPVTHQMNNISTTFKLLWDSIQDPAHRGAFPSFSTLYATSASPETWGPIFKKILGKILSLA